MRLNLAILSSLPGRVRLRVPVSKMAAAEFEVFCRRNPYIYSASFSKETSSVLIYYKLEAELEEIMEHIISYFGNLGQACGYHVKVKPMVTGLKPLFDNDIKKNLIAVGIYMVEKLILPGMVGNRVLSPASVATLLAASGIIKNGIGKLLSKREINADTLTSTAVLAAVLRGKPTSALTIVVLSTVSEWLTDYTVKRTRNHITNMLKVNEPFAWKVDQSGKETKVPVELVRPGDIVAVFMGEKISVDGIVVKGIGVVDESSITGEFLPKETNEGAYVYAGSVLKSGHLQIRVDKVGDETAITRMIKLIEEAQTKQAPIQSFADRMSQSLVPVSFVMAGIVYFMTKDWNRVMNMLFIDYACGLKLSTATAISASIGKAAKHGILIKGGQYLERLSSVNTVVLDKTGTVTLGDPVVKDIYNFQGYSSEEVIQYAASCEEHSSHPIAIAILKKAQELQLEIPDHEDVETIVGKGISAKVNENQVLVGSDSFMKESQVSLKQIQNIKGVKENGLIYVALNGNLIGAISYHDPIRDGMNRTINQLRRYGVDEIILLTGDKQEVAKDTASKLSLDAYYAEALPEDKANIIKSYRHKGNPVMMVGDGINDSPALAYADVGVTLGGKRTDIAAETCDVIITGDDPASLTRLVDLSQNTIKVIQQNFHATIVINSLAMLLGATGTITPVMSAVLHNAATIGVVLNSSRMLISKN